MQTNSDSSLNKKAAHHTLQNTQQLRRMLMFHSADARPSSKFVTLNELSKGGELSSLSEADTNSNSSPRSSHSSRQDGHTSPHRTMMQSSQKPQPARIIKIRRCNAITFEELQQREASAQDVPEDTSPVPMPPAEPVELIMSKMLPLENVSTDLANFILDREAKRSMMHNAADSST